MSHSIDDAVAVHALNALPPAESALAEAACIVDDKLASDYAAYREVATALLDGFPDVCPAPSPEVWEGIARAAGLETAPTRPRSELAEPKTTARWRTLLPALVGVAAVAVAFAVLVGTQAGRTAPQDFSTTAAAVADLPGSITVALVDPTGAEPPIEAVIGASGQGFVIGDQLPGLPSDRTYQLWAVVGDRVVSAGVMGPRPSTFAFRAEGGVDALAITEEVLGGVVASESDAVAIWLEDG